ncbi:hypothetical protein ACVZZ3_004783 [Escherichia coli]
MSASQSAGSKPEEPLIP